MLFEALSATRDLERLHQIVRVFARHGCADLLRRAGITSGARGGGFVARLLRRRPGPELSTPEQLCCAFEELGPSFVKLGQLLAGRSDLLPLEWTRTFARLREHAREVPFDELRPQVLADLGARFGDFAAIDPVPLAAASIAQVHRARLVDGREVVLKIRRPTAVATVEADLRLLARLATMIERKSAELRRYRPRALVRELSTALRNELDFSIEARATERFGALLAAEREIVVPRVHAAYTRPSLLVLDYLDGESLSHWTARADRDAALGARLARSGARVVLAMVFVHGTYHADPHGGNVLLLRDGRLGVLDFGMVGRLSEQRRREFLELLAAVTERREQDVVDGLLGWCHDGEPDLDLLSVDVGVFIERYHGVSLRELDLARLLGDIASIVRENGLMLPPDVALLLKVFVTLEGLGRGLDPEFSMARATEPFVQDALRDEYSVRGLAARGARELRRLITQAPRDLRPFLARLRRGRLRMELDLHQLERFGKDVERSANRLTLGLITAASIVGTAIALNTTGEPRWLGLPAIPLLGFLSSLVLAGALLYSILRSGRD
jgi:ubiquinone biosynthesis protein